VTEDKDMNLALRRTSQAVLFIAGTLAMIPICIYMAATAALKRWIAWAIR
jgi:hypothetical protein